MNDIAPVKVPRKLGEVVSFQAHGRTFEVKKIRADVWHLRDLEVFTRCRFGNLAEIGQDIANVLETGRLPEPFRA